MTLGEYHILMQAEAAIDSLMTQIEQMKGMFDDSDDAIANALQDGEEALARLSTVKKPNLPKLDVPEGVTAENYRDWLYGRGDFATEGKT